MNRTYRLIWNRARQCWNVASELTRARGKSGTRAARVVGASLLIGVGGAQAGLPDGGAVTEGAGTISQQGSLLVVDQQSARLVTEWESFSVAEGHRVEFRQPGVNAAALARVLGQDVSLIQGALSANGQLFLVNPNGIVFAPGAQVDVGSLVASTLDIRTEDFMAGNYQFAGAGQGLIVNRGNIRAAEGGLVALIAARVENVGSIDAPAGTVALAAGSRVRVDMGGPIKVEVEAGAIDALVEQGGAIRAEGGRVYLTAQAAGDLASSAINHGGLTMVSSLSTDGGVVRLEADRVSLTAGSVIEATGAASGGKVDVLGDHLVMESDTLVDVSGDAGGGEILFGGNYLGLGPERNALTVSIAADATLRADGFVDGDGGRVIVWSDERTEFHGRISARGGPTGGDGGFVETSSKRDLIVTGRVTTSAPAGAAGAWLLDPEDVVIDGAPGAGTNPDSEETGESGESESPAPGSFISAESVADALDEGSGVTVYSTGTITATTGLDAAIESGQLTLLSAADPVAADTLPGGGTVVRGDARISSGDLTVTVDQSSQAAAINWSSFSIGRDARVQFLHSSASAATLNRVLGGDPSHIYGRIDALGQVYLVNPSGVLFGASAQVNVGAMVASTLDIDPDAWMDGTRSFAGDSVARVFNEGQINVGLSETESAASDAVDPAPMDAPIEQPTPAYLSLIGREIDNRGTLRAAPGGSIDLVVGDRVNLEINSDAVKVLVEQPASEGTITHAGDILTEGGTVRLQASAVALEPDARIDVSAVGGGGTVLVGGDYQGANPEVFNAWTTAIGSGATIAADALTNGDGGRIIVWADDTTRFAGAVSARGGRDGGDGGFIEVSGKRLLDFRGTADTSAPEGRTGMLLLDPTNITIANTADSATDDPDTAESVLWLTEVGGVIRNHRGELIDPDVAEEFSFLAVDTLVAALEQTHITVTSECAIANCEGWITVSDTVRWDSGNTLSLHATGRVFINADLDARGADGVQGGSVVVRSGYEADGTTSSGLINGIELNDASILTGGGTSTSGAGLAGGDVILQARDGSVVMSGSDAINTSGSAAAGPGDHSGGAAGDVTILAGDTGSVGINLDEYAVIAEAGASSGSGADAARGAILLDATSGAISQDSDGQLLAASLVVTTTTGNVTLDASANAVGLFAAGSTSGNITFNNGTRALTVGTIGAVSGVTTAASGSITVKAGSLTVTEAVSTETGNLSLQGGTVGNQLSGDFIGLDIASGISVTTTGGDIELIGRGGNAEAGAQYGMRLATGAVVQAGGSGTLAATGEGGENAGSNNHGMVLVGDGTSGGTRLFAAGGDVSVTATGGGEDTDTSGTNLGLWMNDGAVISAGGMASVTVDATGGAGRAGDNRGLVIDGDKGAPEIATVDHTFISTNGGALIVTANGGGSASAGTGNDALWLLNDGTLGTSASVVYAPSLDLSSGPNRDMTLALRVEGASGVAIGSDANGSVFYAGTGDLTLVSNTLTATDGEPNPDFRVTGDLDIRRRSGGFDVPFSLDGFITRFTFNQTAGIAGLNAVSSLTITGGTADVNLDANGLVIPGRIEASGDVVTVSQVVTTGGGAIELTGSSRVNVNANLVSAGGAITLTAEGDADDGVTLANGVTIDSSGTDAAESSNDDGGNGGLVTINGGAGGVVFGGVVLNTATVDARGGVGDGSGSSGSTGNLVVTASADGDIDQSNATSSLLVNSASFTTLRGDITIEGNNTLTALSATSTAPVADRGNVVFRNANTGDLSFNGVLQGSTVVVEHSGNLTQTSGSITAQNLQLLVSNTTSDVTLTGNNAIDNLAASITGSGGLSISSSSVTVGTAGIESTTTGVTVQNGAVTLSGLSTLELNAPITAIGIGGAVSISAATNRSIDLGTEDAARLSITEAEFQQIRTPGLTLTTAGSGSVFNTASVLTTGVNPTTITLNSNTSIEQTGGSVFGFGDINSGTLTLSAANGSIRGLDGGNLTTALNLRGVNDLTLSGPQHLTVDLGNSALTNLDITSTSAGRNYTYGVTGASNLTLTLSGEGSLPPANLSSGHRYDMSLTSTGGMDFRFAGNSHLKLGAVTLASSNFVVEAPWGINVNGAITSTSGDITLRSVGGTGSGSSVPLSGTFDGVGVGDSITSTAGGDILIVGEGGRSTSGGHGIYVAPALGRALSTTGAGSITLTGTAGAGSSTSNSGVFLNGVSVSTGSGAVTVTGTTSARYGRGVLLDDSPITTGGGAVTLDGTATGTDSGTHGVELRGSTTSITTSNGMITLEGETNASSSRSAHGVLINSGNLDAGLGNIRLVGNRLNPGTDHKTSVQQTAGILIANGLEVVSPSGNVNLSLNNNVATLAALLSSPSASTLLFDNGGRSGTTTIGTVNGRVGVITAGTGDLYFSNLDDLNIQTPVVNAEGDIYFRVDALTVGARVGNAAETLVSDLQGSVSISGRSDQNLLSAKPISFGLAPDDAEDLHITEEFVRQFNTREFRPRTAGVVTITSNVTLSSVRDRLSILGEQGIETTGNHELILPNSLDEGRIVLDARGSVRGNGSSGSVASTTHAITTRGAAYLHIASGGDINVVAENKDGGAIDLKTLALYAGRASAVSSQRYEVTARNLPTLGLSLAGTTYTLNLNASTAAESPALDFSLATGTDLEITSAVTGPVGSEGSLSVLFDYPDESVQLINAGSVTVNPAAVNTVVEAFASRSVGSFTLKNGKTLETAAGGSVFIRSGGDVAIETGASLIAGVDGNRGSIAVDSGTDAAHRFDNDGTINGESFSVRSNNIDWDGSSIFAGTVQIQPRPGGSPDQAQNPIILGSNSITSGQLDIRLVDLQALKNATGLTIGKIRSGDEDFSGHISIDAALDFPSLNAGTGTVTTLTLATASGNTTQDASAPITVQNLRVIHRAGQILLNAENAVDVLAVRAETGADDELAETLEFRNSKDLTIGTVLGTEGIDTSGFDSDTDSGSIVLTTTSGDLLIANNVNASGVAGDTRRIGRDITLTASVGSINVDDGVQILSLGGGSRSTGTAGTTGGDIALTAGGNLTLGVAAEVRNDGSAAGGSSASANGGAAGEISLTGANVLLNQAILSSVGGDAALFNASQAGSPTDGGAGGDLTIDATAGTVTMTAASIDLRGGAATQSGTGTNLNRGDSGLGGTLILSDSFIVGVGETTITTGDATRRGNTIQFDSPVSGPGDLVLNAGINFLVNDGDVDGEQTTRPVSGGDITFNSTLNVAGDLDVVTVRDLEFAGAVGNSTRPTNLSVRNANDVTFDSTVQVSGDLTFETLDDLLFDGTVGAVGAPVGDIRIDSADNVTTKAIYANSFVQVDNGSTGTTTLNGIISTSGASPSDPLIGTSIANNTIVLGIGNSFSASGTGGVRLYSQTDDLTIGNTTGFTLTGTGGLAFRAANTIVVTADPLVTRAGNIIVNRGMFNTNGGQVVMESPTLLNTNVIITTLGGNVTFQSKLDSVDSDRTLFIDAGSIDSGSGNVLFSGLVGDTRKLTSLSIADAGNVTANGVRVSTFVQMAGTGATRLNSGTFSNGGGEPSNEALEVSDDLSITSGSVIIAGEVNIDSPGDSVTLRANGASVNSLGVVDIAASGDIAVAGPISLVASEEVYVRGDLESTGSSVSIDSAGTLNLTGNVTADTTVTLDADGGILLGGDITTSNDTITLLHAVTLTGNSSIVSGGGLVDIRSTIVGNSAWARDLTIDAGAGQILLGGTIGGTTDDASVGDLTLTTSALLTINHTIRADSLVLNGVDSVGSTTLNTTSITTRGNQNYNNPVLVTQDLTLTTINSQSVLFVDDLTSDANARTLVIDTGGITRFDGAVGGGSNGDSANFASLTLSGQGQIMVNGGTVHTTGAQSYDGAVFLGADTTFDGVNLTFGSVVQSDANEERALTIRDTGTTRFDGGLGGSGRTLAYVDISNSNIASGQVVFNGGEVYTVGDQIYAVAQLLLDDDLLLSSGSSGLIDLRGKVNSWVCEINALTIETQGATVFHDRVGMFRPLGSIHTDGDPTGSNTVRFNTDRIATLGSQYYGELTTLAPEETDEIQFISRDRGTIEFGGTVDGGAPGVVTEIITSGATVFDGPVGSTIPLASLTTTAAGTLAVNGGSIVTTGVQNFLETSGVTLGANAYFQSIDNAPIAFAGAIGSVGSANYDLVVNTSGLITFGGALGVPVAEQGNGLLRDIRTLGGGSVRFNAGRIDGTRNQSFDSNVVLADNAVFTSRDSGDIDFKRQVDSDGVSARSLTVQTAGASIFGGVVGGQQALASVTTDQPGTVEVNAAQVRTTGAQSYNELSGVVLGPVDPAGALFESTDGGAITFDGPIVSHSTAERALTVRTSGLTTFGDTLGMPADGSGHRTLLSILTEGDGVVQFNAGTVETLQSQTYKDAIDLVVNTLFTSRGDGGGVYAVTYNKTIDTVADGTPVSLTVNNSGATVFNGVLGGTRTLASVETDGPGTVAINGGSVTTTGAQTYGEVATLGAATTLTSSAAGDIRFADTVDSAGPEGSDPAYSLVINTDGVTTFDGSMGQTHALASVLTDSGGSVRVNGGLVRTTGNQSYLELSGLTLGSDTRFVSTGTGDLLFAGPIGSIVTEAYDLTVSSAGLMTFGGNLGIPTPDGNGLLGNIATAGGGTATFQVGQIRSVETQVYDSDLVLGDDAVFFSTDNRRIDFQRKIDSDGVEARSLLVETTDETRFGGEVGGDAPLASVETNLGGTVAIDGGLVRTTGFQLYNEVATLAAQAVLTSTGAGEVRFVDTLDGPGALIVNTAGATIFDGVVGGLAPLASVFTDGPGTVQINGGAVTTTGFQNFNELALLGADTILSSSGGGQVRFGSTLDGSFALVINTGGPTVFDGVVGGNAALVSVLTDGPGAVAINGGAVTTSGAQTYNEAATLGADAVLTSTGGDAILLAGTVDGGVNLLINTAGQTRFGGAVGGTTALSSVQTDGPGTVSFGGPLIRTTGAQTYGELPLILDSDVDFESTGNGPIRFAGGPNGPRTMNVRTGGSVTFNGIPGGSSPLGNLSVFAGTLSGRNMVASGNILLDIRDRITLGNVRAGVDLEVRSDRDILFDGNILVGRNLRSVTGRGGVRGDVTQLSGTIRVGGDADFVADTVRNQIDDLSDMVVGGRLSFTNANNGSWRPANDFAPIITNNFQVLRPLVTPRVEFGDLPIPAIGLVENAINLIGFAIAEVEEVPELSEEGLAELVTLFSDSAEARTQARMVVVGGGIFEPGREPVASTSDGSTSPDGGTGTDPDGLPAPEEDEEESGQGETGETEGDVIAAAGPDRGTRI